MLIPADRLKMFALFLFLFFPKCMSVFHFEMLMTLSLFACACCTSVPYYQVMVAILFYSILGTASLA